MANKSVIAMLQKPLASKEPVRATANSATYDRFLNQIKEELKEEAFATLMPKVEAAEEKAKAYQQERDTQAERVKFLQGMVDELKRTTEGLNAKVEIEIKAKDAALSREARAIEKAHSMEVRINELTGRTDELNRYNSSLQDGLSGIRTELGKQKPKAPVKVPQFDLEVVSRDLNGAIKTVTLKPRK